MIIRARVVRQAKGRRWTQGKEGQGQRESTQIVIRIRPHWHRIPYRHPHLLGKIYRALCRLVVTMHGKGTLFFFFYF